MSGEQGGQPPNPHQFGKLQKFSKDVYIELAAFSDSIYERGKTKRSIA